MGLPMSSEEIAIRVNKLSKSYQIYDHPRDRLKQMILPRLQRLIGRKPKSYYHEYHAISDVSFNIKKSDTVGIIGSNGAGKSTLLQIICGTLMPTTGNVDVNGRVAALLELGAGFNSEFTGRENVYMNAAILGLKEAEIDERFDDIVAFSDIGEFIDQPVKTYSSGMYLRLAFAVIAHVDADILVIDEALAVGDAFFVQKCMRFLRNFMEIGTVIFASHDTAAVLNLCKEVIYLEKGRIKSIGQSKIIVEKYVSDIFRMKAGEKREPLLSKEIKKQEPNNRDDKADPRLKIVNSTNLRNDIEIFYFNDKFITDKGNARILSASLLDENDNELSWVIGGERIIIKVDCIALNNCLNPIVGFYLKDRLGQQLFGDNTFLQFMNEKIEFNKDEYFKAVFSFYMPLLPKGEYTIDVAISEGTQDAHVVCHWIYDAVRLVSHSSSVCTGLIGIPVNKIELERIEDNG